MHESAHSQATNTHSGLAWVLTAISRLARCTWSPHQPTGSWMPLKPLLEVPSCREAETTRRRARWQRPAGRALAGRRVAWAALAAVSMLVVSVRMIGCCRNWVGPRAVRNLQWDAELAFASRAQHVSGSAWVCGSRSMVFLVCEQEKQELQWGRDRATPHHQLKVGRAAGPLGRLVNFLEASGR